VGFLKFISIACQSNWNMVECKKMFVFCSICFYSFRHMHRESEPKERKTLFLFKMPQKATKTQIFSNDRIELRCGNDRYIMSFAVSVIVIEKLQFLSLNMSTP
jgi:hypothetical protein